MTLTPAYGRDYASAKAAKADFAADRDFIVSDFFSPYDGKPTNRANLARAGVRSVTLRYKRLTQVTAVKVSA